MVNKLLKYGGFVYFALVFLSIVLTWGFNTLEGQWATTIRLLSSNLLYVILAFGIGVAFYIENRSTILVLLFTNTVISILFALSNFIFILRMLPEVLTFTNWLTFLIPQWMSILTLVGYVLIQKKSGMFLVIIVNGLSGLYAMVTLSLIPLLNNTSTQVQIINTFHRVVGMYASVLIILFVIHYYYKPSLKPIKPTDVDNISMD